VVTCALLSIALWSAATVVRADPAPPSSTEQLVVMMDGRILYGVVQRHAVGYYVERSNGSILVPKEQVRCIARDLADAYRLQREQMLDPTSASLIQLAEWCISYRLYDEAGQELKRALRRDPQNDTARNMLAKLEDRLQATPQLAVPAARVDAAGLVAAEVESLGGLSKGLAEEFTTRIQPLLINKCGNASCHGFSSRSEFRLTHVRNGSANHRLSSQQNLALVLKKVELSDPAASPLLQRSQGAHGGATYATFGGAGGAAQLKTLETWVLAVSREHQQQAEKLANRGTLKPAKPRAATATATVETVTQAKFEPAIDPILAAGEFPPDRRQHEDAAAPLSTLPRKQDAFDPEEFNRQFGGQPLSRALRGPSR